MDKPILKITYNAFASNHEIEDFMHIEDFKADLAKEYAYFIKPKPVGRGGGAYELFVEFLLNTDLKTYLTIIGSYLAGKVVDKIIDPKLDQYLFKPFFSCFKKFSTKHGGVEICEFKIELYNSKIVIYKIEELSIVEVFEKILDAIYQNLENLVIEDVFPSEFTIPVFADLINEKVVYRPPLRMSKNKENITEDDYFKLWKLEYEFLHGQRIYDLVNKTFIEYADFVTEDEYYKRHNER
jgi:hypothetical protein